MKRNRVKSAANSSRQAGFSLLEVLIATAMLATIVTSVTVVLRTNIDLWQDYQVSQINHDSAHGVMRHLIRQIRQCNSVVAISGSSDDTGTLELLMSDGTKYVWNADGSDVYYGEETASTILGNGIAALTFTGYEADGTTETSDITKIQLIRCHIGYDSPKRSPARQQLESYAWIRAF